MSNNFNNWGWLNEDAEKNKKSSWMDMLEFKKNFIADTIEDRDEAGKNQFIEQIMTSDDLFWSEIWNQLERYYAIHQKEYWDINIRDINMHNLRNIVASDFLKLEHSRNNFKKKVLRDFDIDEKEYEAKVYVKWDIANLSERELSSFNSSDSRLTKYLNTDKKLNLEKRKNFKIFSNLKEKEILNRLKWKSQEEKKEIYDILWKCNNSLNLNDTDIRILFEKNFLKKEEKEEFISTFIPFITLAKAVEIWLLTRQEAEDNKREILTNVLRNKNVNISQLDELSSYLSISDVEVETKNLRDFNNEDTLNKIAEKVWFTKFEDDINHYTEERKKDIIDNWPKTFSELKYSLNKKWIIWIDKFNKWCFVEFSKKDEEWEEEKTYVRVDEIDDKERCFYYTFVGWNQTAVNLENTISKKNISYANFLHNINEWKSKLDFFSEFEMREKIKWWELKSSDFKSISAEDLDWEDNLERKNIIQDKYQKSLEEEISSLDEEIKKLEEKKEDSTQLRAILDDKRSKLVNINNEDLAEFENLNRFKEKINELDKEWKNISKKGEKGLFKWMWIKTKEWGYFEIVWIDSWKISLKSRWENWIFNRIETIDFSSFYEAFKKNWAKRLKPVDNFSELINENNTNDKWKNHEFKDWKFFAKDVEDWDDKWNREVEYLVTWKDDAIIKIWKISWNNIEVQFWERQNYSNLDPKELKKLWVELDKEWKIKNKEDEKNEILRIKWAKKYNMTLTELNKIIAEKEFHPDWQTWKQKKAKQPKDLQNKFHWSFASRFFSRTSIKELVEWWKMLIKSIEESLHKWNEVHAAKFALWLWHFLPEELKNELEVKVEWEENEQMEKELKWLTKVDSPIAVKRILKWLKNKNCPEHKKEAWMLFMLENYWHLTAKWPLYEFRWKFLWYEAMWWRINDSFFLEIKKEAEDWDIPFNEEYLIFKLLKKQCDHGWYNWVIRRSRLHKEFEAKWKNWIEKDFEKWYNDATSKRKIDTIIKEWMAELTWWTTSNALWWFKKAVERWWPIEKMNHWFFTLMFSWAIYRLDQKSFIKLQRMWDTDWQPIILARMWSNLADMKLMNKTILRLTERIEKEDKRVPNIYKEAKEIFDNAEKTILSWSDEERKNIWKANEFWKKYWKQLSHALYMNHTKDTTYWKTDKIIALEKDKDDIFKEYHKRVRDYTKEATFKDALMSDACWWAWMWWLNTYEITKKYIYSDQWWGMRHDQEWKLTWENIVDDIEATKKREISQEEKKKYISLVLKDFSAALLDRHWWRPEALSSYNYANSRTWQKLNEWWLNLSKDLSSVNSTMILNWKEADGTFNRVANNILTWWVSWNLGIDPLEPAISNTKKWFQKWLWFDD